MDSLRRDFDSELGKQAARDLDVLESLCPGVRTVVFEVDDLEIGGGGEGSS